MAERLRLYDPLTPFFVAQSFGNNIPCVKDFGLPTQKIVDGADNNTCPVGYEKLYPKFGMSGHNGTDCRAGEQTLYAACDGTVIEKQTVPARGLGLGILTDQPKFLDALGEHFVKVRYWHLKTMYVEVGDKVTAGQPIGITDNTGYSSGNHLHWEGQAMDKDAGGHPYLAFPTNGIGAAFDLEPFRTGINASTLPQQISLFQKLLPLLIAYLQELKKKQQ